MAIQIRVDPRKSVANFFSLLRQIKQQNLAVF